MTPQQREEILKVLAEHKTGLPIPEFFDLCGTFEGRENRMDFIFALNELEKEGAVVRIGTVYTLPCNEANAVDPVTPDVLADAMVGHRARVSLLQATGGNEDEEEPVMPVAKPKDVPLIDKVAKLFTDCPTCVFTIQGVHKEFPHITPGYVHVILNDLQKRNVIIRVKRGHYRAYAPEAVKPVGPPNQSFGANDVIKPVLDVPKSGPRVIGLERTIKHVELLLEAHQATLDTIMGAFLRLKREYHEALIEEMKK